MWVRVDTFEGGDTEKLDLVDERMSSGEMPPPEGMRGVLILDDTDANKRKFLALFESRETLEGAEAGFDRDPRGNQREPLARRAPPEGHPIIASVDGFPADWARAHGRDDSAHRSRRHRSSASVGDEQYRRPPSDVVRGAPFDEAEVAV